MNLMMDISQPNNLVGLIAGAAVVFLFSGLAINAVSRSAGAVVYEVRRQFREHPGIMDYTEKPEYGRVVDICTKDALRELATPGLLAVLTPIAIGFTLGVGALGSFLAGAIGTGTLMAVFLANSGGAWDNAKKLVEDGHHGGKGSEAHAATVIGDTVGDPFKDTAGPAINPLLKVMNLVALLIAPAVVKFSYGDDKSVGMRVADRRALDRSSSSARCTSPSGAASPSVTKATRKGWRSRRTRRWFRRSVGLPHLVRVHGPRAQRAGGRRVLTCRPPALCVFTPFREPYLAWCKWLQKAASKRTFGMRMSPAWRVCSGAESHGRDQSGEQEARGRTVRRCGTGTGAVGMQQRRQQRQAELLGQAGL